MDVNEDAPVITRDEIVVRAPIETIWEIQTNVDEWPSWQPDVDGAESEGPLEVGSVFRWQTAGLDITSTVEEVDAPAGSSGAAPPRASSPSTSGRSNPRATAYSSEPQSRGRANRSRRKSRPSRGRSMRRCAHG